MIIFCQVLCNIFVKILRNWYSCKHCNLYVSREASYYCHIVLQNVINYEEFCYRTAEYVRTWICYQNTHKYKFREITMAHQNLDTFKSVISQVVPIGVLNQLQITKLIVSAPLCFPQIWENWRVVDQSLWHFQLHRISLN